MIDIDLGIENMIDAEIIGQGGFADVYAATDRQLSRRVAIKVLRKSLTASARHKFDRECEIMGRLSDNPHVVTVYSAGYTDHGRPYLVMELLDEGSLANKLEQSGPVPWADAVRYMIPIAVALSAAHRAGVLHRDIKPDNILLSKGRPRLTDFGIAQLQAADNSTDDLDASWQHAAPETLEGERDERSDIYGVASTLYTLIAGHSPFWDPQHGSLMSLVHRLVNDRPPKLDAGLGPPELEAFFERALAKDPPSRPQTADELVAELRQLVEDIQPRAAKADRSRIATLVRGMQPILIGVAVVVISGAIGGFGLFRDGASAPGAETEGRGSLQQPYPLGQSVTIFYHDLERDTDREWSIQLLESLVDQTDEAVGAPSPEARLATARVRIAYLDGPPTALASQLRLTATDDEGDRFAPAAASCNGSGDQLDFTAEMELTETVEGRVCWWVPADEFTSLVLAVEAEDADGTVYLAVD